MLGVPTATLLAVALAFLQAYAGDVCMHFGVNQLPAEYVAPIWHCLNYEAHPSVNKVHWGKPNRCSVPHTTWFREKEGYKTEPSPYDCKAACDACLLQGMEKRATGTFCASTVHGCNTGYNWNPSTTLPETPIKPSGGKDEPHTGLPPDIHLPPKDEPTYPQPPKGKDELTCIWDEPPKSQPPDTPKGKEERTYYTPQHDRQVDLASPRWARHHRQSGFSPAQWTHREGHHRSHHWHHSNGRSPWGGHRFPGWERFYYWGGNPGGYGWSDPWDDRWDGDRVPGPWYY